MVAETEIGVEAIEIPEELTRTEWKRFEALLVGETQLLMKSPAGMGKKKAKAGKRGTAEPEPTPEEQAAEAAYRLPTGELYVPADAVRNAMLRTARDMRVQVERLGRAKPMLVSLESRLAPALILDEQFFVLLRDGEVLTEYDKVDSRRCVNWNMRPPAGIIVHRPLIELPWECRVAFLYDPGVIHDPKLLVAALGEAGRFPGILAYRPEKNGTFGRFSVKEAFVKPA